MLCAGSLFSQDTKWSIQISQSPGKLIKHSKKMKFQPAGIAEFTEFDFVYHTQGKSEWEQYYHLPRMGLAFRYLDLGEPSDIIGTGYGFIPFIDFGLVQKCESSLRFTIGCGLAYLNKTYEIKENPSQTAIGSHWNNLTSFQFRYEHRLFQRHYLSGGISLSHISNGTYQAPNLGLNFIAAIFAYSYHFGAFQPFASETSTIPTVSGDQAKRNKSLSCQIEYGMSLKESEIPGGPKFLIQWYSIDVGYQYNDYQSWRLSLDLERNNLDIYKEYSTDGQRINVYLAHQWLFGNIGLTFRNGYEFVKNNDINTKPIVTKLDLCYVMPFSILPAFRPYLGFSLKAHLATAEYIGIMAGIRMHKNSKGNDKALTND